MTKDEWAQVEKELRIIWGTVRLDVDGYDIALQLQQVRPTKNAIAIYIDGQFKGKYLAEDCEERRRFVCKSTNNVLRGKQKTDFQKLPKKMQKDMEAKYPMTYDVYKTHWGSFGALKRHLVANNQDIQLASIGS